MPTSGEVGFPTTTENGKKVLVVSDYKSRALLEEIWFRLREIKEVLLGRR